MTRQRKVVEDIPANRPETPDSANRDSEEAELTLNNFLEREYYKPNTGDFTLEEYTEKVIQFGYIVVRKSYKFLNQSSLPAAHEFEEEQTTSIEVLPVFFVFVLSRESILKET